MMDLRPCCECCEKELPPDGTQAMLCSFECIFCKSCTQSKLKGICPICGGDLMPRPTRAKKWLLA